MWLRTQLNDLCLKGGKRVQRKRIKFQIKEAIDNSQDSFPLFVKLHNLNYQPYSESKPNFKLIPIDLNNNLPNFSYINKLNPRYKTHRNQVDKIIKPISDYQVIPIDFEINFPNYKEV